MIRIQISKAQLEDSLSALRISTDKEKVILWFGKQQDGVYKVEDVFVPIQITDEDYFTIPPEGMAEILQKLRLSKRMLVAQVHTHPEEAYHSRADDKWAILRHQNAYSIVLPWFCSTTNADNFIENAASFILSAANKWEKCSNSNIIIL